MRRTTLVTCCVVMSSVCAACSPGNDACECANCIDAYCANCPEECDIYNGEAIEDVAFESQEDAAVECYYTEEFRPYCVIKTADTTYVGYEVGDVDRLRALQVHCEAINDGIDIDFENEKVVPVGVSMDCAVMAFKISKIAICEDRGAMVWATGGCCGPNAVGDRNNYVQYVVVPLAAYVSSYWFSVEWTSYEYSPYAPPAEQCIKWY